MTSNHCQHEIGYAGTCWRCGMTTADVISSLEPARIITVDPHDLLGWEDGQDEERIEAIRSAMLHGEEIPPILTNEAGWALYDGHHRAEAARRAGLTLRAVAVPRSWALSVSSQLATLRMLAIMSVVG